MRAASNALTGAAVGAIAGAATSALAGDDMRSVVGNALGGAAVGAGIGAISGTINAFARPYRNSALRNGINDFRSKNVIGMSPGDRGRTRAAVLRGLKNRTTPFISARNMYAGVGVGAAGFALLPSNRGSSSTLQSSTLAERIAYYRQLRGL